MKKDVEEIFFCIDGEAFLLKNASKIKVSPKQISNLQGKESSIIIVRGPHPHLPYD